MVYAILTCSEHFTDLALNELNRHHPDLTLQESLHPHLHLIKTAGTFDDLTYPWRNRLPIYLHHLFPVDVSFPLKGQKTDLAELKRHASKLSDKPASVQVRIRGDLPYSAKQVSRCISPRHHQSGPPSGQVLSIFILQTSTSYYVYMGLSWASQNLSPWPNGRLHITEKVLNRAGLKLIEALDVFQVNLRQNDHALDLGAAPGAWTQVLRRRGLDVTAVAPDEMYPWLLDDRHVRVFQLTAQEYLPNCETTYDLIVNDMKLDARDSARIMLQYADHLRPEGIAIMSLKLYLRNRRKVMDHAFRLLRQKYKIIRVRQLVSNRKEVTVFLRLKQ